MRLKNFLSNPKVSRYAFLILLLLVLLNIILGSTEVVSRDKMMYFLLIPALLELIFILFCLVNIAHIITHYRALKKQGDETMDAWQQALEHLFPPRLVRLVLLEAQLYYALYLSFKRNPLPDNSRRFATRLDSYLFLIKAIIVLCLLEIAAVSIMLPDRWLTWKLLHLILGLWTIIWLWADVQAMRLYTHQITGEGVKFRVGLRCCQEIPWKSIISVKRTEKSPPGLGPGLDKKYPGCLFLATGDRCNIEIELQSPQSFQGMISYMKEVKRLYLSLETPEDFINAALHQKRGD